ncbi:hypothetical protein CANCADRAFT_56378 [Tortispora caseinolytica NRRL Y-17796]|uniref:RING-type domain-containing protein n=1 Tax=Tortispora caseinolytica NRRL Y-17796 TaxID=767744 RepID=A0A1E4TM25_9ASCO|nr:hypothetical protein CANCADRAFT_56378 [Tortispora caseinolytica NRRL Y-17796]
MAIALGYAELKDLTSSCVCSICSEIMCTPVITECGHSYCYECLLSWFETSSSCPHCRTDLKQKPIRNIALQELITKIYNIVNQETEIALFEDYWSRHYRAEKHLSKTLQDGGMFPNFVPASSGFYDADDDVRRCIACGWEIYGENSSCTHCGRHYDPNDDYDYDDEDDEDEDELDQEEQEAYLLRMGEIIEEHLGPASDGLLPFPSDEEYERDSFVASDNESLDDYSSTSSVGVSHRQRPGYISSSSENSESSVRVTTHSRRAIVYSDEDDESESSNSDSEMNAGLSVSTDNHSDAALSEHEMRVKMARRLSIEESSDDSASIHDKDEEEEEDDDDEDDDDYKEEEEHSQDEYLPYQLAHQHYNSDDDDSEDDSSDNTSIHNSNNSRGGAPVDDCEYHSNDEPSQEEGPSESDVSNSDFYLKRRRFL